MIKVYIAGPYRAQTTWGIHRNIENAKSWGLEVAKLGGNPFIPHANTGYYDGELPCQYWLDADIEWLEFCDCMFVMPGSEASEGVANEIAYCELQGIPVYHTLAGVAKHIRDEQ